MGRRVLGGRPFTEADSFCDGDADTLVLATDTPRDTGKNRAMPPGRSDALSDFPYDLGVFTGCPVRLSYTYIYDEQSHENPDYLFSGKKEKKYLKPSEPYPSFQRRRLSCCLLHGHYFLWRGRFVIEHCSKFAIQYVGFCEWIGEVL